GGRARVIRAREGRPAPLHGGRCRTQDDRGRRELAETNRGVAGLEPWSAIALVGRVAPLAEHEHPAVGERCDDGEPRTDDDVDIPGADAPPFVGALTLSQAGM